MITWYKSGDRKLKQIIQGIVQILLNPDRDGATIYHLSRMSLPKPDDSLGKEVFNIGKEVFNKAKECIMHKKTKQQMIKHKKQIIKS